MGMTMTQKILAAHAGLDHVVAGQLIEAKLDMVLGNDVTSPVAINEMNKFGKDGVFDKTRIALVMDHFTPNKDIQSAQNCKQVRTFARAHGITHYFDVGNMGIEHALLPEQGIVACGDCVIGADSHTCTYGALGAFSTGVGSTDMAAGMVTGKAWFKVPSAIKVEITGKKAPFISGKDVVLHLIGEIGVDGALYQSLEFTGDGIAELSMDDRLCISNMAIECGAKNGIFPVDDVTIYLQCIEEGLTQIFIEAGAVVSTPTCGPCLGGHMGILAAGERAVSTSNRNFVGRMGHTESEIYLASPAVAAASAVKGYIADPATV